MRGSGGQVTSRGTFQAMAAAFVASSLLAGLTATAPVLATTTAPTPSATRNGVGGSNLITAVVATDPLAARIRLVPAITGLSSPVLLTNAGDGSGRLFVVEKTGRIRVVASGHLLSTPYLNISSLVSGGSEQGLLGLAFSPSFKSNHKLYIDYTNTAGNTVIAEYRQSSTSPNIVATSTRRVLLTITQPYANHNGGMLAFGPDGDLYIGMGDGGSGGDPGNRAQSLGTLLGKLLRIDVRGSTSTRPYLIPATNPYVGKTGLDEIWSRGLRNPWRFSFDRATGHLWIGDVGQDSWEEVDLATSGRGLNFGWRIMEGRNCYNPPSGCSTTGLILPPVQYDHSNGRCAVTGGYVYRGTQVPALYGGYVFGDYCSGEIWVTTATSQNVAPKALLVDTSFAISSFGESQGGELYVCDLNGTVYKVAPA